MTATAPPQVHVLYGSETGNAEFLCDDLVDALARRGIAATTTMLDDVPIDSLAGFDPALLIVSTTGDGDMPYGAGDFWEALDADEPDCSGLRYAVLALGDSTYAYFCHAGTLIDERLAQLGASQLAERVDCDAAYDKRASAWIAARVEQLAGPAAKAPAAQDTPAEPAASQRWTREHPYEGELTGLTELVAPDAGPGTKQVLHCEIDLSGSEIEWAPGDSLGVVAVNDDFAVEAFLRAAGLTGDEHVGDRTIREQATSAWELRFPPVALMTAAGITGPAAMASWAETRTVAETLAELPSQPRPDQLAALMRPIRARAYSIAGSAGPGRVALTVAVERPDAPTLRVGVAGGYLEGMTMGRGLRVFPMPNRAFHLPDEAARAIVMVGAGVGVAPYRAFLQARAAQPGHGPAWLIAGHRYREADFLYEGQWREHLESGALTELDTAFSRDGRQRIYVQHRIRARGADLARWLAEGAVLYVCGDASAMAPEVERTVREVLVDRLGDAQGRELFEQMRAEGRYRTDVY